ncbi:MAG: DUF177 domain-containing protein [Oscillospiraceae bacterium]|jgi:uncharacterized protein|nr:DUF177 domain-containing protein [Oscillospiraceae bacterium]
MVCNLESVFQVPGLAFPFDYALPVQPAEEAGAGFPFAERPQVQGEAANRAGVVTLTARIRLRLTTVCDRCAAPMELRLTAAADHVLVASLNNADNDELVLVNPARFSPDELLWEDIVLAMPARVLCREDCQGLCPQCGRNRNEGPCACAVAADPRLAALRGWKEPPASDL